MQEKKLIIFDEEEAYVEALSDYLNRKAELGIIVLAFSNGDKLKEYLSEKDCEYLLINETVDKNELPDSIDEGRIITLSSVKESEKKGAWIYKYQSAQAITKELKAILVIKNENIILSDSNIHTVFSTKSGIERETYVKILLSDLKSKGSVLYINMEPFQESATANMEKGMSELIYYLKQDGKNLKWRFKSLICKEDVSGTILPVNCAMDLCELNKKDVIKLLEIFKECLEYDFILINLGLLSQATFELIKASNKVEIVVTKREEDKNTAKEFVRQLKMMRIDTERRVEIVEIGAENWL